MRAMLSELPTLILREVNTRVENDFITFCKDVGVVLTEVKGTTKNNNVNKADEQLINIENFIQAIWLVIAGPSISLPIVKQIIVPHETTPSPMDKTDSGCHIIYGDRFDVFHEVWNDTTTELKGIASVIDPDHFQKLVELFAGIWCMKPVLNVS